MVSPEIRIENRERARKVRLHQLVGLMCVLALGAGCDFTPVLDIPLPEYQPGLVLHGVLMADSTVSLSVTWSRDPYTEPPSTGRRLNETVTNATVELIREGGVGETLRLRSEQCTVFRYELNAPEEFYECGTFVSRARIDAGATYTLRVRAEGHPDAEATVTVPARVDVPEVTEGGAGRVSFRLRDPEGRGDHYALQLSPVRTAYTNTYPICNSDGTSCRDTTVSEVGRIIRQFASNDPFLIASAQNPGNDYFRIVAFNDRTFDGTELAVTIEPEPLNPNSETWQRTGGDTLWLIAIDEKLYDAYQITTFSLGEDNPFEEPSNLPSNVIGGYGLVGAATIHARELPSSPARHAGR
ncbi:MAG: hypothetical protein Rubg2KO_35680 [Rubricoccaceae bacterium]